MFFFIVLERGDFSRFGGDLLSQGLSPSTIGAAVLNFRVRDGTGCFTCAMTTKPRKIPILTFLLSKKATGGRQRIRLRMRGATRLLIRSTLSNSRSVYALVLSFHYWIKSSLSGD